VLPIFVFNLLKNKELQVYGDGEQTRDLVNVHDVVQANIKAAHAIGISGAFNIASGTNVTINHLIQKLQKISNLNPKIKYIDTRPGDVRDSLAEISAAKKAFGYAPNIHLAQGLKEYVEWAQCELVET